ncbi:DUF4376 domain-containing protein [Pseudomonas asturiensis]|uniref:DUF4376 domain-containing protein n=1 Tax=Pseudomonas asturiensis TaxID=1190415 RepID=A0ABX6HAB0_9PSED|nr:DUF4376 domain-containing protein [Pseudomonas asturiensis]QHF02453.1 DUF4376 domain-containing protein [Pseudomonas asturiensis]
MQTVYRWNEDKTYAGSFEAGYFDDLPIRTTLTAPPELEGDQVAIWTGEGWSIADGPPAATQPDWLSLIAARRYQAEISGITLEGLPIETDDRSKLLINGAAARAARDSNYTLKWKTFEGFVDLPAAQVLIMADAVSDHVQDCFNREAELQAAVAEGSITAEMLDRGWPS